MWKKLHVWGGVILAIPMLIIGVSTIFIAHGEALGAKQLRFTPPQPLGNVKQLLVTADGFLLGGKYGVVGLTPELTVATQDVAKQDIKSLRELNGQYYAATKYGVLRRDDNSWTSLYQGDTEDIAWYQDSLLVLDKKRGLLQQQGDDWRLLLALEKDKAPRDLNKLMKDLHTGEALLGDYDWIWMDILGAYIILFTLSGIWLWSRRSQR